MPMGEFPVMGDMIKLFCPSGSGEIDIKIPVTDLIRLSHSGSDLYDRRRPEGIIEELFFSAPGHLNRFFL